MIELNQNEISEVAGGCQCLCKSNVAAGIFNVGQWSPQICADKCKQWPYSDVASCM